MSIDIKKTKTKNKAVALAMASAAIVSLAPNLASQVDASENTAPTVVQGKSSNWNASAYIEDRYVYNGDVYFTDAENPKELTYTASNYDESLIKVIIVGNEIELVSLGNEGTTPLTITATDPQGASVSKTFNVTAENRGVELVKPLPDLTLDFVNPLPNNYASSQEDIDETWETRKDDIVTLDLSEYFVDHEGDEIEFYIRQGAYSNPFLYKLEGMKLSFLPTWYGSSTFTIVATSINGGYTIEEEFTINSVKADNTRPYSKDSDDFSWSITGNEPFEEDGRLFFGDLETPDDLTYTVSGVDESLIKATVDGQKIKVEAVGTGQTSLTLTATDSEGLSASRTITFNAEVVENEAPTLENTAPTVVEGKSSNWSANMEWASVYDGDLYFTDAENPKELTYTASNYDESLIEVKIVDNEIELVSLGYYGTTSLTITATDPQGASVSKTFNVSAENMGVELVKPLPELTFDFVDPINPSFSSQEDVEKAWETRKDDIVTIDLSEYFVDPEGDEILFRFLGKHLEDKVYIEFPFLYKLEGMKLSILPTWYGSATLTIDAFSPSGGYSVETELTMNSVKADNTRPFTKFDDDLSWTVAENKPFEEDGRLFFDDLETPDGLTYTVSGVDESLINVTVNGSKIKVEAVGTGQTAFTLTATDSEGLSASTTLTFNAVVAENTAPTVTKAITDTNINVGETFSIANLGSYFTDEENSNELVYTVDGFDSSLAEITIDGSRLDYKALKAGETDVTITATDPKGKSISQTFKLQVENPAPIVADTVQNVQAAVVNETVKITWDSLEGSKRYRIQTYVKDANGEFVKDGFARTVTGATSYTFTSLQKEKEYKFEVVPYVKFYETERAGLSNSVVIGNPIEEIEEGTEGTPVETPVEIALNVVVEDNTATLTWNAVKDVTYYRVEKYVKNDNGEFVKDGAASSIAKTTHTYKGLEEGKEYKFIVTPRVGYVYDKEQAITTTVSVEGSTEAPEIPTTDSTENGEVNESTNILNAKVEQNGNKLKVTWGNITVKGKETSRYRVQLYVKNASGTFEKESFARSINGNSYEITTKPGQEYQFEIIPQANNIYDYNYAVKVTL